MTDEPYKPTLLSLELQSTLCCILHDLQDVVHREICGNDLINHDEMDQLKDDISSALSRVLRIIKEREEKEI